LPASCPTPLLTPPPHFHVCPPPFFSAPPLFPTPRLCAAGADSTPCPPSGLKHASVSLPRHLYFPFPGSLVQAPILFPMFPPLLAAPLLASFALFKPIERTAHSPSFFLFSYDFPRGGSSHCFPSSAFFLSTRNGSLLFMESHNDLSFSFSTSPL